MVTVKEISKTTVAGNLISAETNLQTFINSIGYANVLFVVFSYSGSYTVIYKT